MGITIKIALYLLSAVVVSTLFLLFYRRSDRSELLRFLRRLVLYSLPLMGLLGLFLFGYRRVAKQLQGIPMHDQIITSAQNILKKPYHTIIMGNSRTYRGINPDMFDSLTYNFSFDNETFLEQDFKFQYLKQHDRLPKLLVLGVDYFEFSFLSLAMRESYREVFGAAYDSLLNSLSNAQGAEYKPMDNVDDWVNSKMGVFGRGSSQYLDYLRRRLFLGEPMRVPYLKDNGQYIIDPVPDGKEGTFMTRSIEVQPYQKERFEALMAAARNNRVQVVLLMAPCRDIELACYTDQAKKQLDDYFRSFERPDSVWYLNMSAVEGFSVVDFMDDTHLKPQAADRYSRLLNQKLQTL